MSTEEKVLFDLISDGAQTATEGLPREEESWVQLSHIQFVMVGR